MKKSRLLGFSAVLGGVVLLSLAGVVAQGGQVGRERP